jgi:hypothetical protein
MEGAYRFYDPRRGELSFSALDHFAGWFPEYLKAEGWDYQLQKEGFPFPPIRMFSFGGRFSRTANSERVALQNRFWDSA